MEFDDELYRVLNYEGQVVGVTAGFSSAYGHGDGYACDRCFKTYYTHRHLVNHMKKCKPTFSEYEVIDGIIITKVDYNSPKGERQICHNIAVRSADEDESGPLLQYHTDCKNAVCFIAFDEEDMTCLGYIYFGKFGNQLKPVDLWVPVNQRGKGYERILQEYAKTKIAELQLE